MPQTFSQAVALFAAYSFLGWLLELAYRSVTQRRWVNPGFLRGPFVPLYGWGAVFAVALSQPLQGFSLVAQLLAYGLALTALEYLVGAVLERALRVRLWDYSDHRFNLRGRIALSFSAAWAVLAFFFIRLIHPRVLSLVRSLDPATLRLLAVVFLVYLALDAAASVAAIRAFRAVLERLRTVSFHQAEPELRRALGKLRHLRSAFPHLNAAIIRELGRDLRHGLDDRLQRGYQRLLAALHGRQALEPEYEALVADILRNRQFQRLRGFRHHDASIYEHACKVSYLSYRICKSLDLDVRSAARGGLLHDFFLYDWRHHHLPQLAREKFHGLEHPRIALANAEAQFTLNAVERDCILRHMWPLTLVPPRYLESFIVSMADKLVASREFINPGPRRPPKPAQRARAPKKRRKTRAIPAD